jgi:Activator of Hsp90 ATPase, N-terminal
MQHTPYNTSEMTATFGVGATTDTSDSTTTTASTTAAAAPDSDALAGLGVKLATATGTVYKVEKIEGDASVVTVRGKRRYLFDYSLTLKWRIEVSAYSSSVTVTAAMLWTEHTSAYCAD